VKRRQFVGLVTGLFSGAGLGATETSQLDGCQLVGDVDTLVRAIDYYGPRAVAERILASPGDVDPAQILRDLRRQRNRDLRARRAGERRERHAGSEILYRGPLLVRQRGLVERHVRSQVTRHTVAVGETTELLAICGIGIATPERREVVADVDVRRDGSVSRDVVQVSTRDITIPRGSRVLLDTRRGWEHEVWAAELLVTAQGQHRLHLWQGATAYIADAEALPRLAGGVICATSAASPASVAGLLGLPLREAV